MSVSDGGDDIGGNPEQVAREGKDITDPAGGKAEHGAGRHPQTGKGPCRPRPATEPPPTGAATQGAAGIEAGPP